VGTTYCDYHIVKNQARILKFFILFFKTVAFSFYFEASLLIIKLGKKFMCTDKRNGRFTEASLKIRHNTEIEREYHPR
jgi:hypothetical protein